MREDRPVRPGFQIVVSLMERCIQARRIRSAAAGSRCIASQPRSTEARHRLYLRDSSWLGFSFGTSLPCAGSASDVDVNGWERQVRRKVTLSKGHNTHMSTCPLTTMMLKLVVL